MREYNYYGGYFDWLCDKINLRPGKYDILMHELYSLDFEWVIELDFNRAEDGIILRGEYDSVGGDPRELKKLENKPCSVLEALIALSRAMDFIMDDDDRGDRSRIWFWEMISNLGLGEYEDVVFDLNGSDDDLGSMLNEIDRICMNWMDRSFEEDGFGSPFPLMNPHRDQRELHMIDQMNDYILEKHMYNDEIL